MENSPSVTYINVSHPAFFFLEEDDFFSKIICFFFLNVAVDTSSTHHSLIDLGPSSPNNGVTIKREPVEHKPLLHNILSAQQPHLGPAHVSLLTAHRTNAYTTNTNGKSPGMVPYYQIMFFGVLNRAITVKTFVFLFSVWSSEKPGNKKPFTFNIITESDKWLNIYFTYPDRKKKGKG